MKFLNILFLLLLVTSCNNNKNVRQDFDPAPFLLELKEELSKRDIQIEITEKGLYDLEKTYTALFKEGILDQEYFIKYSKHILTYIGECHIKEHGGKWFIEYDRELEGYYDPGIICKNGKIATNFSPVWNDIIYEQLELTGLVLLSAPYSTIKPNCNREW